LRKFIFIALSVFLLLSLTVLAYAEEPQIKLGGRILVRGWYFDNVAWYPGAGSYVWGLPEESNSTALYSTNAYITIDAKVSDNVQGYMELETSGGNSRQSGLYVWDSYEEKPNENLKFRQLWMLYKGSGLLGVPAGIKIGHMPLTLGEKQFLNHERFGDDAILVYVEPTKELFLAAATVKLNEGYIELSGDDIDANVILGTYKLDKDNTVGINYTYIDCDDVDLATGVPIGVNGLSLQNLGLHANGQIAGVTYAAEFDTQFGKLQAQPGSALDDQKYRGWAIFVKGGYAIPDTSLTLRGSFAMGSGDSDIDDNKTEEFQTTMGYDTLSPLARYVHYTQIYERTINTAAFLQSVGGPFRNTGIANTTYYNLGLDLAPTKDISLSLDGFILRATKTGAWEDFVGSSVSKSVGTEVDFKGSYKIAKNLTYFVEAGIFSPGDFYKDAYLIDDDKTVKQVVHGINLTF